MDYTTIAVAFGMLTLFLIVAEFFIPSGGLITLAALICVAVSVWGAHHAWAETRPVLWWSYLVLFFSLIPGTLFLVLGILPKTKMGKRWFLEPKPAGESAAFQGERDRLSALIGKQGTTATLHSPGGMVTIDGKRYHSESEGIWLEPETAVVVIGVRANRLLLREQADADKTSDTPERDLPSEDTSDADLDFQVPRE